MDVPRDGMVRVSVELSVEPWREALSRLGD